MVLYLFTSFSIAIGFLLNVQAARKAVSATNATPI